MLPICSSCPSCAIAFFVFIRFISKISPQKVSNPVSVVLSHHLQPLSPSFPCFFPSLHPSLTISKLEALYQQLVSWPMAHVQKVKHPSLSVSMPTLLSAGIACAGKKNLIIRADYGLVAILTHSHSSSVDV